MTHEILRAIEHELERQANLKLDGKFTHTAGDYAAEGDVHKALTILTEEVGEVARALNDGEEIVHLKKELIQCAAVCVSFAIGLEFATVHLQNKAFG